MRKPTGIPSTARGLATQARLLAAAEIEFGRKGYCKTSVAEIVLRAGVGAGTFYLYFPSKKDALRCVLRRIGDRVRRVLRVSAAAAGASDEVTAGRLRASAYIGYMARHWGQFRIVQEAVFYDERAFREYQMRVFADDELPISESAQPSDDSVRLREAARVHSPAVQLAVFHSQALRRTVPAPIAEN